MSSPGAPTENSLNIMPTYGALLIGCFLSQAVWGISSLQVFLYFKNFEHDSLALKLLVVGLWLADTANEVLLLKSGFRVLILEYGKFSNLADNTIETTVHTLVTAVVVFIVQMYFVRRIYLFGKKNIWIKMSSVVWIILATWQLVGPIVYWVKALGKPLAEQGKPYYVDINISLRAAAFYLDVTVALCMIWLLTWNHGPYLTQTKKMVFRILIVTINSGTWTALMALVVLILLKVFPTTLYFCIVEFSLCSLYVSTFLANLNSRYYVRGEGGITTIFGNDNSGSGGHTAVELGAVRGSHPSSSSGRTAFGGATSTIIVTKHSEVYAEPEYLAKA